MSNDPRNPISNETGEYINLDEKVAEKPSERAVEASEDVKEEKPTAKPSRAKRSI